jgi:ferredoxin-type protein NapG
VNAIVTATERRRFLGDALRGTCTAALMAVGLGLLQRQARARPAQALRPPGAIDEARFLGACVRCGLCVRACPFDTLRLAPIGAEVAAGTPYFIARDVACEMCDDIPCVAACPTGALDSDLERIDDARMGLAVVVDQTECIAFQGLRCEVCFNSCPLRGAAITLEYRHNARSGKHAMFIPRVDAGACTGCGKCEQACILGDAAIKVLPRTLARGERGAHYRLGWEERARAGEPLVAPDRPHEYNLPEGMRYEHGGAGLVPADPIDALNRGEGY